ncbi:asparagine synthase (glutamine-hydrolyzing) [Magnetospirillum fulvum]|nr:asparagine synthase (glutamine-hydrolyzing) [Magnetospirillum fulvum]
MCGLIGLWDRRLPTAEHLQTTAQAMADSLIRRGPDGEGIWIQPNAGLALGHRRLAVVDLTEAGQQPMTSACGRYVIVYNGEIFNAPDVAADLQSLGIRFRGHSDTEVLLEACAAWGVEAAVSRFIGMFAFALWDCRNQTLSLVRDRMGVKPLYWGMFGDLFLFGSELKALRAHPGWEPRIDRSAVSAYLRFAYVPCPLSIYQGVSKLPPAHILTLGQDGVPRLSCYWDSRNVAQSGQSRLDPRPFEETAQSLDSLLRDAVGRRMVADVPLGAFLSGGVDSSLVVALMQAQSNRSIQTFSIGFHEARFNEADHARAVAAHLGTDHTELIVEPRDAWAVLPDLAEWFDEPFADSSQIPTYLVSALARQSVTVALSGDGGDELFAGYTRYRGIERLWRSVGRWPHPLRHATSGAARLLSPTAWDAVLRPLPRRFKRPQLGDKIHKAVAVLDQQTPQAMYRQIISYWSPPELAMPGFAEPLGLMDDPTLQDLLPDTVARLQYIDMSTYLPDDILTKVDRASMAISLETRVPLLDHRLVEFAWTLPPEMKIAEGQGKAILRRVLDNYVPRDLIERPKMGFGIPIDEWLRGPLRDWADNLLEEQTLSQDGLFDAKVVRDRWHEHLSGSRNWHYSLWAILMFQSWKARWLPQ